MSHLLVVNGPNLNMLGKREPEKYGKIGLEALNKEIKEYASGLQIEVYFFQSNHEGEIIERIHLASEESMECILINPAAFTHTSVAIRDALLAVNIPVIEVHLTNIHSREPFRHKSFISDIAQGVITGFGVTSYFLAVQAASDIMKRKQGTK